MKLITNTSEQCNHATAINVLIDKSDVIILCTSYVDGEGIKKIIDSLNNADKRNSKITIYSNKRHQRNEKLPERDECGCAEDLVRKCSKRIIYKPIGGKYLHSKIYYFQHDNTFTALIGSANLTLGGLTLNDELSVELKGDVGSAEHSRILEYLRKFESVG